MNYIIIGAGVAGISAVREIIKNREEEDNITVITDEIYPFYYRPRLIECLSGEVEIEDIIIHSQDWFEDNDITIKMGETVKSILHKDKKIITDRDEYRYDKLLIANGAHCFIPPIKGREMDNIFALRDAADVKVIRQSVEEVEKAVVLGGGLLGLESACNLKKAGLEVIVVEIMPRLLPVQLDEKAAGILKSLLENKGLKFYLDTEVDSFIGDGTVGNIKFKSGKLIDTELVLISAGIRPNISLARTNKGIDINKGVVVNEYMETGVDDIYAAGDIAEYQGRVYGIWGPSQQQGRIAGLNMIGKRTAFNPPVPSHKLKVAGINVVSVGELDFDLNYRYEEESGLDKYRKVIFDNKDNPIGTIIVGDYKDTNEVISSIKK